MTPTDAKTLCEYIRKSGVKLNTWETNFLNSMERKALNNWTFSNKEATALNNLYAKSAGGGVYQKKERIGAWIK